MPEPRDGPDVEREASAAPLQPDEAAAPAREGGATGTGAAERSDDASADPTSAKGPSGDGSEVAAQLRTAREREGLSRGTLASLLGLPERTLEDVEAGDSAPREAVERVETWLANTSPDASSD